MRAMILAGCAAALLGGCGGAQKAQPAAEETAAALQPGEYEVAAKVTDLRSIDNSTPATKLKAAAAGEPDPAPVRACVAADGSIDAAAFAEADDSCKIDNSYTRNGTLNLQLACTRKGNPGQVMQVIEGKFKTDSFEAEATTNTYFTGTGDYSMTRKLTGKRVAPACTAPAAEKKA